MESTTLLVGALFVAAIAATIASWVTLVVIPRLKKNKRDSWSVGDASTLASMIDRSNRYTHSIPPADMPSSKYPVSLPPTFSEVHQRALNLRTNLRDAFVRGVRADAERTGDGASKYPVSLPPTFSEFHQRALNLLAPSPRAPTFLELHEKRVWDEARAIEQKEWEEVWARVAEADKREIIKAEVDKLKDIKSDLERHRLTRSGTRPDPVGVRTNDGLELGLALAVAATMASVANTLGGPCDTPQES